MLTLISFSAIAQDVQEGVAIIGKVQDKNFNPIESAVVTTVVNNSIKKFTVTNNKGEFKIDGVSYKNFTLNVRHLGYNNYSHTYSDVQNNQELQIILNESSTGLDEVVLSSQKAIIVKKDAVVFNASSFTSINDKVVEDLLRNIPGIEVDDEGLITVNGTSISKLLVEGDDLFGKGYSLVTKNLNSKAIDKVEILNNYTSNRLFQKIEPSSAIAINLTLKEENKSAWLSDITAGYGLASENRYTLNGVISNFSKKSKYFINGKLNNLGVAGISNINQLTNANNSDNHSDLGKDSYLNPIFSLNTSRPFLDESRSNFNNSESLAASSIFNISKKVKVKISTYLETDDKTFNQSTNNFFTLGDASFINNTETRSLEKQNNIYLNADVNYDISDNHILRYESRVSKISEDARVNKLFNDEQFTSRYEEDRTSFTNQLSLTNKISSSEVLHSTLVHQTFRSPLIYQSNGLVFLEDTDQNIKNTEENHQDLLGIESAYLKRFKNGHLFESSLSFLSKREQLRSALSTEDAVIQNNFIEPQDLLQLRSNIFEATPQYTYIASKLSLQGGLTLIYKNDQRSPTNLTTSNIDQLNLLPSASIKYKFSETQGITIQYQNTLKSLQLDQLSTTSVLSTFRSTIGGLKELEFIENQILILNYKMGDYNEKFLLNGFLRYNLGNTFVSENIEILPEITNTQLLTFNNREDYSVNISTDYYLDPLSLNIKLKGLYGQNNYQNELNSILRNVKSENSSYGFELKSVFKNFFNFTIGHNYLQSISKTNGILNKNENSFSFFDINLNHQQWSLSSQYEFFTFKNNLNSNNNFKFLDFQLNYIHQKSGISFTLLGNNLLDTKIYTENFVSDINSSTSNYNLIGRYVLLQLNFGF